MPNPYLWNGDSTLGVVHREFWGLLITLPPVLEVEIQSQEKKAEMTAGQLQLPPSQPLPHSPLSTQLLDWDVTQREKKLAIVPTPRSRAQAQRFCLWGVGLWSTWSRRRLFLIYF